MNFTDRRILFREAGGTTFIFYIGIILAAMIILASRHNFRNAKRNERREKNPSPVKAASQNSGGSYFLPMNHEKDIIQAIRTIDPYFQKEKFITGAQDLFCGIQKALTAGDLAPIRPFVQDALYSRQQKQTEDFRKAGLLPVSDSVQIQRCYLHLYERDEKEESLTVFITAAMCQYLLDKQSMEIVDGDKDDILKLYYFLTFQRKCGVTTGTNLWNACPKCGAPLKLTESGDCGSCHAHLTSGDYGWVLGSVCRIHDFSDIDERGVVIKA